MQKRSTSVEAKKDPEVLPEVDKQDFENDHSIANQKDKEQEVHKDFGKVPKYINKYKEDAAELDRKRAELKAA